MKSGRVVAGREAKRGYPPYDQPIRIAHTGIIQHERSRDAGGLPVTETRC